MILYPSQLDDEVAKFVRESIMTGRLRPGEFIRINKLAEELGVSSTPVRQALVTLRGEGFAHLEPRKGFVVADLSENDILDMYQVQAFVAGELAAHAALCIDGVRLARLEDIGRLIAESEISGDVSKEESFAHEFHEILFESANRPKLQWMLQLSGKYEPRSLYSDLLEWRLATNQEHRRILDAVRQRDAQAARSAMSDHVLHLGELVAANFREATSFH
jgi:DNA-binding GntR family transcriptional regulator